MCPTKQERVSLGFLPIYFGEKCKLPNTNENAAQASDLPLHFHGLLRSTKASLIK